MIIFLHLITLGGIITIRHNLGLWLKVDAGAVGKTTPKSESFTLQYAAFLGKDQVS
jgi:hypothetical protein